MEDLKNVLKENLEYYLTQERNIVSRLALLPKGNIKKKRKNNEWYYYLQYRKGKQVKDEYIGKIVPDQLKEKLLKRKVLLGELTKVRNSIKLLKQKSPPVINLLNPVKEILSKFSEMGLWDYGIEIIGSWCFIIYQNYLPVEKYPLKTQDLDILIPFPYKGKAFDFTSYFRKIGFEENFNPDGSIHYSGSSLKIEFLSPRKGRKTNQTSKYIEKLSLTPQTLNYIDILFKNPLEIKIAPAIKVKVPSIHSFILHKFLIASLGKRKDKREKDLKQAVYAAKSLT